MEKRSNPKPSTSGRYRGKNDRAFVASVSHTACRPGDETSEVLSVSNLPGVGDQEVHRGSIGSIVGILFANRLISCIARVAHTHIPHRPPSL